MEGHRHEKKKVFLNKARAMELYSEGLSRRQIAAELDVTPGTVGKWMRTNGLADHDESKQEKRISPLEQDAHDADLVGMTYGRYKWAYPAGMRDSERKKLERLKAKQQKGGNSNGRKRA